MPGVKHTESKMNVSLGLKGPRAVSKPLVSVVSAMPTASTVLKSKHHCTKCVLMKRFWMVSVNMYDFMGLIDICPGNTLHAVKPYVSCKN